MFKSVKLLLVLILPVLQTYSAKSQNLVTDSSVSSFAKAVDVYNASLAQELGLFNGRDDKEYAYNFDEGTPYFITNKWSTGTVDYDGKTYDNVSLLYDVARDELMFLYFDKISRVRLLKEKVAGFTLLGHSFINLMTDSSQTTYYLSGFYDRLYHGNVSLLVKRTKNIQTSYRQTGFDRKVFDNNHYYLQKANEMFAVKSKKSFLEHLGDKRKEMQQFMRQNNLNFRRDKETTMTKTLAYYNELTTKQ